MKLNTTSQQLIHWGEDETPQDIEDELKEDSAAGDALSDGSDGSLLSQSEPGARFDDDSADSGSETDAEEADHPAEDSPLADRLAKALGDKAEEGGLDQNELEYYLASTRQWEAQILAHSSRVALAAVQHNPALVAALSRCLTRVIGVVPECPKASQGKRRLEVDADLEGALWSKAKGEAPHGNRGQAR